MLFCYYSPFFDAAFNGSFEEGVTQSMDIVDVDPKVFALFLNWLYTQNVAQDQDNAQTLGTFINLWLLDDRFLIPKLQNETLVALDWRRMETGKRVGVYHVVYNNTVRGSPLRRYLAQTTATGFPSNGAIAYEHDHYPPELVFDMFEFLRTQTGPAGARRRVNYSKDELRQFFVEEGETKPKEN
ncbi:hypothetical protein LSUB1_G000478 [Lachnellula subtilissima]|uniref:BTB domain-containing protein n=1 Tax=Lachnellula subtilissima TaxID=602034 RepID=A0A8H8UHZ6_9HELO|nr:hypothetical protein LSUB1_G000478 [Lachnellula subtilissima]